MDDKGFTVLRPGVLSLIQDYGRVGFYRHGVSIGGPVDRLSFDWANRLVGNPSGTVSLEISLGGLVLECRTQTTVAITGAQALLLINEKPASLWRGHHLNPGDRLEIGLTTRGVRLYLAVAGGFSIAPIMGSAATVVRERLGGLGGRALQPGDFLPCTESHSDRLFWLPAARRPKLFTDTPLRMIPCCQARDMPRETKHRFFTQGWRVDRRSDRMGYRLQGRPLEIATGPMISEGVVAGSIQIPPDGLPIVMLQDHQTIGGYPKIGALIAVDCWRLAQMTPGTEFFFAPVTQRRALRIAAAAKKHYEATSPKLVD